MGKGPGASRNKVIIRSLPYNLKSEQAFKEQCIRYLEEHRAAEKEKEATRQSSLSTVPQLYTTSKTNSDSNSNRKNSYQKPINIRIASFWRGKEGTAKKIPRPSTVYVDFRNEQDARNFCSLIDGKEFDSGFTEEELAEYDVDEDSALGETKVKEDTNGHVDGSKDNNKSTEPQKIKINKVNVTTKVLCNLATNQNRYTHNKKPKNNPNQGTIEDDEDFKQYFETQEKLKQEKLPSAEIVLQAEQERLEKEKEISEATDEPQVIKSKTSLGKFLEAKAREGKSSRSNKRKNKDKKSKEGNGKNGNDGKSKSKTDTKESGEAGGKKKRRDRRKAKEDKSDGPKKIQVKEKTPAAADDSKGKKEKVEKKEKENRRRKPKSKSKPASGKDGENSTTEQKSPKNEQQGSKDPQAPSKSQNRRRKNKGGKGTGGAAADKGEKPEKGGGGGGPPKGGKRNNAKTGDGNATGKPNANSNNSRKQKSSNNQGNRKPKNGPKKAPGDENGKKAGQNNKKTTPRNKQGANTNTSGGGSNAGAKGDEKNGNGGNKNNRRRPRKKKPPSQTQAPATDAS